MMEKGESSKMKTSIISASSFIRSVTLHDWWLLKTSTNRLAVGGFATRERQGIRVFCSGAIAKRHDATTLETVDGITITIVGFLNKSRTLQNGFPPQVCKHFLFGFPYHWEGFAYQCVGGESESGDPTRTSGFEEFNSPASLDELPVTRVRDVLILMPTLGDSKTQTNGMFSDILGRLSNLSNVKGNSSTTADTELDRTPRNHKKADVEKFRDDNSILDASDKRTEECKSNARQSNRVVNDPTPSRGVLTRSMTKLKNLKNQLEGNISSSTRKKQKTRGF